MTIQRPNCMKTLRQGSVSISLSPAARPCAVARPASGVSGYQDPSGGHEEGAVANHRERPVLWTLRCGSAAECRIGRDVVARACRRSVHRYPALTRRRRVLRQSGWGVTRLPRTTLYASHARRSRSRASPGPALALLDLPIDGRVPCTTWYPARTHWPRFGGVWPSTASWAWSPRGEGTGSRWGGGPGR